MYILLSGHLYEHFANSSHLGLVRSRYLPSFSSGLFRISSDLGLLYTFAIAFARRKYVSFALGPGINHPPTFRTRNVGAGRFPAFLLGKVVTFFVFSYSWTGFAGKDTDLFRTLVGLVLDMYLEMFLDMFWDLFLDLFFGYALGHVLSVLLFVFIDFAHGQEHVFEMFSGLLSDLFSVLFVNTCSWTCFCNLFWTCFGACSSTCFRICF